MIGNKSTGRTKEADEERGELSTRSNMRAALLAHQLVDITGLIHKTMEEGNEFPSLHRKAMMEVLEEEKRRIEKELNVVEIGKEA